MRIVPLPSTTLVYFNSQGFLNKRKIFKQTISMLIDAWQDRSKCSDLMAQIPLSLSLSCKPLGRREKSSFCSSFLTQKGVKRIDVTLVFLLMIKLLYKFYEYF